MDCVAALLNGSIVIIEGGKGEKEIYLSVFVFTLDVANTTAEKF